jgi:hypothetical protein
MSTGAEKPERILVKPSVGCAKTALKKQIAASVKIIWLKSFLVRNKSVFILIGIYISEK